MTGSGSEPGSAGVCVGDRLPIIRRLVTQEQVEAYARSAKDFNPIHLDEEFASTSRFGRRIAHGMLVLAFVSEMLETAFPGAYASGGELSVRFKAPVYPGETIETFGQVVSMEHGVEGDGVRCTVGCRKSDGSEALTGHATAPMVVERVTRLSR